jgi:hypothetical protein
MSVILKPTATASEDLQLNWWIWRPIMAELRRARVVTDDQFERMSGNFYGGRATAEDAVRIADHLEAVAARLGEKGRLLLDGSMTTEPDSYELHHDDVSKNYSAPREHVTRFIAFCRQSGGFAVI